jgi:hypothetical protein
LSGAAERDCRICAPRPEHSARASRELHAPLQTCEHEVRDREVLLN